MDEKTQKTTILNYLMQFEKKITKEIHGLRTDLQDVNGKLRGHVELLQKDISNLADRNELQHQALDAKVTGIEREVERNKDQISNLYDLHRKESEYREQQQHIDNTKLDTALNAHRRDFEDEQKAQRTRIEMLENNSAASAAVGTLVRWILGILIPMLIAGVVAFVILFGRYETIIQQIEKLL